MACLLRLAGQPLACRSASVEREESKRPPSFPRSGHEAALASVEWVQRWATIVCVREVVLHRSCQRVLAWVRWVGRSSAECAALRSCVAAAWGQEACVAVALLVGQSEQQLARSCCPTGWMSSTMPLGSRAEDEEWEHCGRCAPWSAVEPSCRTRQEAGRLISRRHHPRHRHHRYCHRQPRCLLDRESSRHLVHAVGWRAGSVAHLCQQQLQDRWAREQGEADHRGLGAPVVQRVAAVR